MSKFQKKYWDIRRKILKSIVPNLIWPKELTIDGVSFLIRNAPYSFGTKRALVNGTYEVSERNLLQGQIRPGDVVIEMGGSIGILTAILGKYVGSKGFVVSVEASSKITSYSKTWLEKKGNIKVLTGFGFPVFTVNKNINIANFDETGGSLSGRLYFDIHSNEEGSRSNNENIYDIQTIMRDFGALPTILVIDVEGTEKILITEKPDYPATVRLILMEVHTYIYGEVISKEIVQRIIEEGFNVLSHEKDVFLFERN